MSPAKHRGSTSLHLMVGAQELRYAVSKGSGRKLVWLREWQATHEIHVGEGLAQLQTSLLEILVALRGSLFSSGLRLDKVSVLLADVWVAGAGIPWGIAQEDQSRAETEVCAQLGEMGFDIASGDIVRIDDGPYGQSRLAIAYPAALLTELQRFATELGGGLASILPISVAAWEYFDRRRVALALAIVDDGWLMLIKGNSNGFVSDVSVRRVVGHGLEVFQAHWQRMSLRDPSLAKLKKLSMIDMARGQTVTARNVAGAGFEELSDSRTEDETPLWCLLSQKSVLIKHPLNAIASRITPSPLGWMLCIIALTLMGVFMVNAASAYQQLLDLRVQAMAYANHDSSFQSTKSWTLDERAQAHAVNHAVRQLNLPVSQLLLALQPPQDIRVSVTNIDIQPTSSERLAVVKILAEAQSEIDMTRYVVFVSGRKPFVSANLTKHEVLGAEPSFPWRFTMEAQWEE